MCESPCGKRSGSAPNERSMPFSRSTSDHPSSISTQDTGTFLRRNSSILAMIARSSTFCPSESHVHHPSPVSSCGNARSERMRTCVRAAMTRTHSWMARYGSSDTAATHSIPDSCVKPIALMDAHSRSRPSETPISARTSSPHAASITHHVSDERHSRSWVRSGMSANAASHAGRIHHSLCWYKARMSPSFGMSMSRPTSTARNGSYVSCSWKRVARSAG